MDAEVVAEATPGLIDPDAALAGTGRKLREEDLIRRVYTQQQLDEGVVLHAAVMLNDPEPARRDPGAHGRGREGGEPRDPGR